MRREFRPELDFTSSPVLCDYIMHWPESPVERAVLGVFGPVGSGKSTGCCAKLMMIGMMQLPDPRDNIRKARLGVVRNTTPMLKSTTIKTWINIFPEETCGKVVYSSPIVQRIKVDPGPKGEPGIDFEIMFLALDNEKDLGKLKSLDWTAVYINEADLIHPSIFRYARRRLGRYPHKVGKYQAQYPILIMDCNSVDEDHQLAEWYANPPEEWHFWKQPPAVLEVKELATRSYEVIEDDPVYKGRKIKASRAYEAANRLWILNPDAENLAHLQDGYYETQLAGSKLPEIQADLQVKFVFKTSGKPVIPDYADDFHSREFPIIETIPLELCSDVGGGTLNPAGLVIQRHPRGAILVHDELAAADVGVERFSKELRQVLNRPHFATAMQPPDGRGLRLHTDPAGSKGDEIFNVAVFDHLKSDGWDVKPAWTNDINMRIESITNCASRNISGLPGLMVHKRCKLLRKALSGKWQYRRLKISGLEDRHGLAPDKTHPWSDVGDALGYGCMGLGETRRFQRAAPPGQQSRAKVSFDVYGDPAGNVRVAKTDFNPHD
jgi:hypothetical protein